MGLFRSIVFTAALAGLIAGAATTLLHMIGTARLIAAAEIYEKAAEAAPETGPATSAGHAAMAHMAMPAHEEAAAEWEPADGIERTLFTALADILTGIGFALLVASAFALRGGEVDWRVGLYWGLAGFAAFTVAPGIGLPPMVPGTEAAPLEARQLWWTATVAATGGGLALLFFTRRPLWVLAGLALLVAPHLLGAPQPAEYKSAAPPELAHRFIVAAVITSFLSWVMLGALTGALFRRFHRA